MTAVEPFLSSRTLRVLATGALDHQREAREKNAGGPGDSSQRVSASGSSVRAPWRSTEASSRRSGETTGRSEAARSLANPPTRATSRLAESCEVVRTTISVPLLSVLRIKFHSVFALGEWTSICGNVSQISCHGTICCVCVRRRSSTQRASGSGLVDKLSCRRWYTYSVGRLGTTCDVSLPLSKEDTSCQHLAMPACSDTRKNGNAAWRSGAHPGDSGATRRTERTGGRTRSRTRSRLDPHPPLQECAETVRVSADAGPLRHGGSPKKEARGSGCSPRGRGRLIARESSCSARWRRSWPQNSAVAVSDGDGEMLGMHSCLAGGCRTRASVTPITTAASFPKVGATEKVQAKKAVQNWG